MVSTSSLRVADVRDFFPWDFLQKQPWCEANSLIFQRGKLSQTDFCQRSSSPRQDSNAIPGKVVKSNYMRTARNREGNAGRAAPAARMASSMRVLLVVVLTITLTTACRATGVKPLLPLAGEQSSLPPYITLVSWNVHKQRDARLPADLHALVRQQRPTLVFLQEATAELLDSPLLPGHFAPSWHYPWRAGSATGVLTFSQVAPTRSDRISTRWREFFLTTPKAALATEYLLPDGTRLLAVNIHCLNFERWGTLKLRSQLTVLQALMATHRGALLLVGDFNTWNQRRDLQLREVREFSGALTTGDRQSAVLNWLLGIDRALALDRVYYRGLTPLSARVLPLKSSDHRALQVTFAVESASEERREWVQ
jgi:endonuclease/exonuclease/phosphatase (EEP) superfamily protein YafD